MEPIELIAMDMDGTLLVHDNVIPEENVTALRQAHEAGIHLALCSGRIPDDMMEKVIRARVPVLASNAVPTDKAVALARKYHVTLICSARPDGMDIFSGKGLW